MSLKIVAFSGKMQRGKTTCAQFLRDHLIEKGVPRDQILMRGFANELKSDLVQLGINVDDKNVYNRRLMQAYGQAQRARDPDYWIKRWWWGCPDEGYVIVDDMRFRNEFTYLKERDAQLVRVIRTDYHPAPSAETEDESETALDLFANSNQFDCYLVAASGELERLKGQVELFAFASLGVKA